MTDQQRGKMFSFIILMDIVRYSFHFLGTTSLGVTTYIRNILIPFPVPELLPQCPTVLENDPESILMASCATEPRHLPKNCIYI